MPRYEIVRRRRQPGANLAILCAVGALIIGFMGLGIYGGLQTYLETDLERSAMNAAMAGAAAYYARVGAAGKPSPDPDLARGVATATFGNIVNNSSLQGFGAALSQVTNNDVNDSVTVVSTVGVDLPFLAPVGVRRLETTATATARALRYEPTSFTGPIRILPVAGNLASYSQKIRLAFPLVDGPGNDLYVEQDATRQQAYLVEACNDTECYSLTPGATPVGSSRLVALPGGELGIVGTAVIDLARAGVRKAGVLRFVHGNDFNSYNAGVLNPPPAGSTPLEIRRVMLFGYAGACVDAATCPIPAGFSPVE